jgi:signal transduction histidine kinase
MALPAGPVRQRLPATLVLGVALVGAASYFYATSNERLRLADQAALLAEVDLAITAAETAEHHLARALLLATEMEAGITNEKTLVLATDAAASSLQVVASIDLGEGLQGAFDGYIASGEELLIAIESGDLSAAREVVESDLSRSYDVISASLASARNMLLTEIAAARSASDVAATVSSFVLVLLVPGAIIVAYRSIARRQLRRAELENKLTAERELSRSKDEFIANISHELRTPLTSIYGFAKVLEDGSMYEPEVARELLDLVITESLELERMVDDLLTAARASDGVLSYKLDVVDLRAQLAEVVPAFERQGGSIPIAIEAVPVIADPLRLRQVLRNLIANARKHGGEEILVLGGRVGDRYELRVVDDGEGVPGDLFEALFERFVHVAAKPLVAGSVGLGLHIARTLARGMGGDLEYRRDRGRTHFILSLNLAPEMPSELATQEVMSV